MKSATRAGGGLLSAAALSMLLSACAGMQELRDDENALALHIKDVQTRAQALRSARDGLARTREQDIKSIGDDTRKLSLGTAQRLDAWQLARDPSYNLLSDLRGLTDGSAARRAAALAQQAAAARTVDDARSKIDIKTDRLAASAKAMAQLAERKSRADLVKFYVGFVKDVQAKTAKLEEDAKKEAGAAADASKAGAAEASAAVPKG